MMDIFDIIKFENKYVHLEDIPRDKYVAYCYDNDDPCILAFLNEIGALSIEKHDTNQKHFNPLLIKQDIVLAGDSGTYQIPFLLIKYRHKLDTIEKYSEHLKREPSKLIYQYIIKYIFSKNIYFINILINILINIGETFDLSLFSVLNRAFTSEFPDEAALEEAIGVLNGREIVTTPVYGRYIKARQKYSTSSHEIYSRIKNNTKKKNIILIHLESLSNEIYYNQLHNLPTLKRLMSDSLQLGNYYSSASSSCMSLIDLFFGNDFESDSFPLFDEMFLSECHCKNMYQIFQDNGYKVLGIGYKELKSEEINHFNLWSVENQKYEWKDSFDGFIGGVEEFINNAEKPFALHIWNLMTHIGHNDVDTYKGATYLERMDLSYTSLDMTIEFLLDCLNKKGILNDSVIIGYGDHGDDKWTRSMNYGCTHIIPPHLNVIKCPAFIFDSRIEPQILNDIVSTVDIKNTALFLAGIEREERFPHQGVNIFEIKNDFAYSRSHLTNQRLDQKINSEWVSRLNHFSDNEHKNKSFGAINHSYNMVVSNNGLEFFMHRNDPGNYNNLLNFFEMDAQGNIIQFNNHGAWRGHFRSIMMVDDQIYDMIYNYYTLRKALIDRILLKNSLIQSDERNLFDMSLFNVVCKRGFVWS